MRDVVKFLTHELGKNEKIARCHVMFITGVGVIDIQGHHFVWNARN
jgi:hypothetical protein